VVRQAFRELGRASRRPHNSTTASGRDEVGGMLWSELRLPAGMWSIGADRTKNRRPHDVPLSSLALEILNAQSKREERDLVFGAREGAFQGWSKAKEALDKRLLAALKMRIKRAKVSRRKIGASHEGVDGTVPLSFRVMPKMKQAIDQAARDDRRSVSSLTQKILADLLDEHGYEWEAKKK